jgi:DNA-directed RNA polymerase beta' subunit
MIKNEVLGGRINFSSRCVIIPNPELRADQIVLCYKSFLELFKYEIIAYLTKMDGITAAEANELWFRASVTFNQKIYEIMKYFVEKRKVKVLINRNPKFVWGVA